MDVEDQMDWIGDKLTALIEEGKRALGREVVVMSDAREDEVDDGRGGWVDDEMPRPGLSRSGSVRSGRASPSKRPRGIDIPANSSPSAPFARSADAFTSSFGGATVNGHMRHRSEDVSGSSSAMNFGAGSWTGRGDESDLMKDSMERARERVLAKSLRR